MSDDLVNIEVNGVALKARKGEVLIRATDREGIYIPRFCYHDKLPIAANCRMCLVEIEKAPKPMPACATPVTEGMKVFTKSPRAIAAQRSTMEFLLINHPLDCPICDQGGECELQDQAVGFGRDISRFFERKLVVKDQDLGPLISTDMTRCIQCTRCVRFGQDIAGIQELGTIGRGESVQISTYVQHSVNHELSGNIIDLCPVGALNSKPFRFRARAWEMTQAALISPHDGVGSQLYGHVLRGRLMRVVPRPCDEINETWIADRDRFSYEGIYSDDRVLAPQLRQADGSWREVDWNEALAAAADGLRAAGAGVGLLAHPSSTLEELYLLGRLGEGLGTANIDHRLRQRDFRDQNNDDEAPSLGLSIAAVDALNSLLVIGSNLRHEVPLLAHRVRKAALHGAQVSFLNPVAYDWLFPVAAELVVPATDLVRELAGVLRAALGETAAPPLVADLLSGVTVTDAHRAVAATLGHGQRRAIWLGALAQRHSQYGELRQLARALAQVTGASLGDLAEGANAAGAFVAGALPHRSSTGAVRGTAGLDAARMLQAPLAAYLLLHCEPWADAALPAAVQTLAQARCVVAITPYATAEMRRVAHVLLPAGTFAESSGTYVNLEGRWQSQAGAALPLGAARPAWKILRVLGNLLNLTDFDYQSSEQVRDELRARIGSVSVRIAPVTVALAPGTGAGAGAGATFDMPMYQIDPVVRRASSLQRTQAGQTPAATWAATPAATLAGTAAAPAAPVGAA